MAIPHAAPGEKFSVRPLGAKLSGAVTTTLVKTRRLEIIRLVIPAGKEIPPHHVAGPITVQCLEGRVAFKALGETQELEPGDMLHLAGTDEHSLIATEDASVLVTILL